MSAILLSAGRKLVSARLASREIASSKRTIPDSLVPDGWRFGGSEVPPMTGHLGWEVTMSAMEMERPPTRVSLVCPGVPGGSQVWNDEDYHEGDHARNADDASVPKG